jgi:hypothetical protein
MSERRTVYLPVDELVGLPRNSKDHDDEHLAKSVDAFGWVELIVLDERTGQIVSGHGRRDRLKMMRANGDDPTPLVDDDSLRIDEEGRWLTPVTVGWASRDDAHAEATSIALNRVGEGLWNRDTLSTALDDLLDKGYGDAIGFSPMDLDDLRLSLAPPALEDLAEQLGKHDPTDAWPTFRVRLPQPYVERMNAWWAALGGTSDVEKVDGLLS